MTERDDDDSANVIAWIVAAFILLLVTLMAIRSFHE